LLRCCTNRWMRPSWRVCCAKSPGIERSPPIERVALEQALCWQFVTMRVFPRPQGVPPWHINTPLAPPRSRPCKAIHPTRPMIASRHPPSGQVAWLIRRGIRVVMLPAAPWPAQQTSSSCARLVSPSGSLLCFPIVLCLTARWSDVGEVEYPN
jgi:hypothetical protein